METLMDFNYFDIAIVVIILITALIGFMRGIVWMGVFLATWTLAIFLAIRFKDDIAQALPIKLGSEVAQTGLAALAIFLSVLIAGAIVNFILHKLINAIGLGVFDRILGTGLGIVLGAFAITLLTMLLSLTELPNQELWKSSKFIPKFQEFASFVESKVPENFTDMVNQKLGNDTLAPATEAPAETQSVTPAEAEATNPN